MTSVEVLPADSAVLDRVIDPAQAVVVYLERAKVWLTQATDIVDVVEIKARAEAMRVYVTQKELARDAEVAAAEMVRRAERRIGQLIAEKQQTGEMARRAEGRPQEASSTRTLSDLGVSRNESSQYQRLAEPDDSQFEQAVAQAKAEDNPSRANVLRKANEIVAQAKEKAADLAEGRQVIRELEAEFNPPGFDRQRNFDLGALRGQFTRLCRDLVALGDPETLIADLTDPLYTAPGSATERFYQSAVEAADWLAGFITAWEAHR